MDKKIDHKVLMRIDAYLKGSLSEAEIQELWQDFAAHPHLLEELESELHVKEAVERSVKVRETGKLSSQRVSYRWIAAAAAVVLLVALLQFFKMESKTSIHDLLVQEINLAAIEASNGLRTTDTSLQAINAMLDQAFEQALLKNDQAAIDVYENIMTLGDPVYLKKAALNKGILLYNEGNYSGAITAFEQARLQNNRDARVHEKTLWFLGNALMQNHQEEEGMARILETYNLNGVYRSAAFLLLKQWGKVPLVLEN